MDRHPRQQTHRHARDRDAHGNGGRDEPRDRDRRPTQDGEPPSRPLLDRLTEAGWGRWVPMSTTHGDRES